jgi:acyl-CoA reductase-like NAD-dependent aldehyde dehydrogenase
MRNTTKVLSPYDQREIGEIPKQDATDVDIAVATAKDTLERGELPTWRRAEILYDAAMRIGDRREEIAQIISAEAAKPISAARSEAARALSTMGWASIAARNLKGEMIPMEGSMVGDGKLAYTLRKPIGVVGAITPFNFPLNLVCHKIGPAIAAGCPVVLKPASQTPFSAYAFADILSECGLPPGWLSIVTGSGSEVGAALVEHPDVSFISFTGSAEVGWSIPQQGPRKKVSLELGNSTPVIVDANSNWELAADGIAVGGFAHAGQSCISVQRVYVHQDIADQFTERLVSNVGELVVGDPSHADTNVSSLITTDDRDRVHSWIREAVEQGGHIAVGGELTDEILQPTVITNANLDMKICSEEVFGPVVAVQTYTDFDEAIGFANGTKYGLQAGIFTNDLNKATAASSRLQFGAVLVNEVPTWRADLMPYGGTKESGNTREGPVYALDEMTEPRLVVINT